MDCCCSSPWLPWNLWCCACCETLKLTLLYRYYADHPHELAPCSNVRAIGLCTGLLSAAAVVSARSLSELIPLGVECVRIAFRTGACAASARDALDTSQASWSTVVSGLSEEAAQSALAEFHESYNIPSTSKAYLSAISPGAMTVSGPPSTTDALFQESELFAQAQKVPIPVMAPYHAPHLFSSPDVARILDDSRRFLRQFHPLSPVQSASDRRDLSALDTSDLFEMVVTEILEEPVQWGLVLQQIIEQCSEPASSPSASSEPANSICTIHAIGRSHVTASIASALRSSTNCEVFIDDHQTWADSASYKGRTQADKIAIVGMAGRFPDAADHEALWDLLMKGLDVHKEVPKTRFDPEAHTDPSGKGKNKSHTPYGCFIDEPGLFDPRFFNMSPREAAQTDPMARLALTTAYEALEMSGYVPNRTPSSKLHRIGTFYGQTSDDWREVNSGQNVDTYFITGGVRAFAPGRINYYFKFSGPSFSIDTACSSSLAAIQVACTSLWAGDCDTAVTGGLNVMTNPDVFAGLSKGQFLSRTGSCKTYDNTADGYCRGDGCASVILKRYSDAVADKDNILGCILANGTNHSADAISITHPHAGTQEFLYKKILADAGVDANDVSYVEMHGTGTQAGDGVEMESVTNVFAARHRRRRADQPLFLGSIKANIGHGEAASGTNALIKLLMMMERNEIPPNVGIKGEINKTFPTDLAERNVCIPNKATPFPRDGNKKRYYFLNNFSAAGGNTGSLLEDPPLRETALEADSRTHHVVVLSARAISSLKRNVSNFVRYLDSHPSTDLSSLAYTTGARRIQHNYRVAITASDISQVKASLESLDDSSFSPVPLVPTRVAFAFTGQGSQYTDMGKVLYEDILCFRDEIDKLDMIARLQGLPSFLPLLQGADVATLSPVVVQLGMACIQVALVRVWATWGIKPTAVIGHSLGEYAALQAAGVISASDMIHLVGRRAELLVAKCTAGSHGMTATRANETTLRQALGDKMPQIACRNGPTETVLSDSLEAVQVTNEILEAAGIKSTLLKVPYAFHSSQVDEILPEFVDVAKAVTFHKPEIPVLSPLMGKAIQEHGFIDGVYLARHAREPVNFMGALQHANDAGVVSDKTSWLEIGAHPVCSNMIKASLPSAPSVVPSLRRNEDPWKTIASSIADLYKSGVYIDFNEYHSEFNACQELLVLPTYSFENKNYWIDYQNNWTLTKGEDSGVVPAAVPAAKPKFSTTSCQEIVAEEIGANSGSVTFRTNLDDPQLSRAVRGHVVNDNPLYPSSLYADQAVTVADYLYKQMRPQAPEIGLNVCKMEVPRSLIAQVPPAPGGQFIHIEGTADLEAGRAIVKFRSVTPDGKTLTEHAECTVQYEEISSWRELWNMSSWMVQQQIRNLHEKLEQGKAHKFLRGMAYRLFKNFVNYSAPFQGMEQVVCSATEMEASATVSFQTNEKDGKYVCPPFWIDSLCHLSGFICNGTDLIDSENNVCISHGWGSMRLAKPLEADKKYTNYVHMLPVGKDVYAGDVYIFDGEELVGVVGSLKFQQIPRRLMNVMLPAPKSNGVVKAFPAPASIAAPPRGPAVKATVSPINRPVVAAAAPVKRQKKTPQPAAATSSDLASRVMKIISEETDTDIGELVDGAAFQNLGVDSLLSLTIAARLREELDVDIPANIFVQHDTVGALRSHFAAHDTKTTIVLPSTDESELDDSSAESCFDGSAPVDAPRNSTPPSSAPSVSADEGATSTVREIIAHEMGITPAEIPDGVDLAELGLDSLMSLAVLSALREVSGIDMPSTFFAANSTIEDVENALGMRPKHKTKTKNKPDESGSETPKRVVDVDKVVSQNQTPKASARPSSSVSKQPAHPSLPQVDHAAYPPATSILLSGAARTSTRTLFLLPDGSGSASSYMNIPTIDDHTSLVALSCPFLRSGAAWTQSRLGLIGIVALYIAEIQRRQPHGPYLLGGWSAGGVMAYEVARQLLVAGEAVRRLILIDSPTPSMAADPLPDGLHLFFDEQGLLGPSGRNSAPPWVLEHFAAAIDALGSYVPLPLPEGVPCPDALAVWATRGLAGDPDSPQPNVILKNGRVPRPMEWLLNHRTGEKLGPMGWEEIFGEGRVRCVSMECDHFSMMRIGPVSASFLVVVFWERADDDVQAKILGRLITEGLDAPAVDDKQ